MTNLDYLRTLSAEELAEWFYGEWLHHMQYRWSSSQGGMVIWLNEQRAEQTEPSISTNNAQGSGMIDSSGNTDCSWK